MWRYKKWPEKEKQGEKNANYNKQINKKPAKNTTPNYTQQNCPSEIVFPKGETENSPLPNQPYKTCSMKSCNIDERVITIFMKTQVYMCFY